MDKTYVFDNGANTQNGLLASILPALQNRGVDTAALLAMAGNGGNGFFGNNGGFQDIIALIVIAAIFGNGNFGFGGNGNNNSNTEREMLMSAIQRNGVDLNGLANTLHCSVGDLQSGINNLATQICNLSAQNGQSSMQIINAIQAGNTAITSQICNCCCDLKQLICNQTNTLQNAINSVAVGQERGFSNLAYETQNQTCSIEKAIAASTSQILEGQRAAEMREMQDKLDALRERNSQQATMINNAQQTATISAMIAPLAADLEKIKCKLPETVTLPYSCATAVPTQLVYGNGFGLGLSGFGLYGNCGCSSGSLWG